MIRRVGMRRRIQTLAWSCVVTAMSVTANSRAVEPVPIMYRDPQLTKAVFQKQFPPGLADLWVRTLERPERELRRLAAASIAQGQRIGLADLQITIEPLMKALSQASDERMLQLAIVDALVALDARQAAELLHKQLQPDDLELAELIEPALARWNYAPMRKVWLTRLAEPIRFRRMHVLAIRGLLAARDTKAVSRTVELAVAVRIPTDVRLEAATAAGQLQDSGLLETAQQLAASTGPQAMVSRRVAACLLRSHRGPETQQLLASLAVDQEAVVRIPALEILYSIDPDLILPLIDATLESEDVHVRRWGAQAMVAKSTVQKIGKLAPLLNDPDPSLRRYVCDSLVELGGNEVLREAVVREGRKVLATDAWRGQEQATLLLVTLDDKSIAEQLVGLLSATRPEVHVTAAWGLCELQVPATLEPMLNVFSKTSEACKGSADDRKKVAFQLSYLAQAFGRMKYDPAEPLLRTYVPKDAGYHPTSRAAAIWALGWILAERPDRELADRLLERMFDCYSLVRPEDAEVGRMAAIALGRMKSAHALDDLRGIARREGLATAMGFATAWAIERITGEPIGEVPPIIEVQRDWLLSPNELE
jgi:HEAT repeat protein